jgi:hypothetical protein
MGRTVGQSAWVPGPAVSYFYYLYPIPWLSLNRRPIGALTCTSTGYTQHPYAIYNSMIVNQTIFASDLGPSGDLQPTAYTQAAANYPWLGALTCTSTGYTQHPYAIYNSIIVNQTIFASDLGPSGDLQPTAYTQTAGNYPWHGALTCTSTAYTLHPYGIWSATLFQKTGILQIERFRKENKSIKESTSGGPTFPKKWNIMNWNFTKMDNVHRNYFVWYN